MPPVTVDKLQAALPGSEAWLAFLLRLVRAPAGEIPMGVVAIACAYKTLLDYGFDHLPAQKAVIGLQAELRAYGADYERSVKADERATVQRARAVLVVADDAYAGLRPYSGGNMVDLRTGELCEPPDTSPFCVVSFDMGVALLRYDAALATL